MENPVKAVTSGWSVGKILALAGSLFLLFAILDLTGLTGWILYPVTSIKNKYAAAKSGS